MKNIIIVLLLIGICSCKTEKDSKNDDANKPKETEPAQLWYLTNYFDSIVKHKKVAEYTLQEPVTFGIILNIKKDSIDCQGSIFSFQHKLLNKPDTLAILYGMGDSKWKLTQRKNELYLSQIYSDATADTITYIYCKRKGFADSIFNSNQIEITDKNITNYLNSKIIASKYLNKKDTIEFKPNGQVLGFKNYNKYKVHNYFGTLHPFRGLDVIFLENHKDEIEYWNWKVNKNNLTLIKFEIDKEKPDYYRLTNEKIEMKRITDTFVIQRNY